MTLGAIHAELSSMHVARAVTVHARGLEVLCGEVRGVAGVADNFLVPSLERPLGIARVIERDGRPLLVAVARVALHAEAPGMRVFAAMAALAILGNRIL